MKKAFTVRLEDTALISLGKVANTYGMEPTTYGAAVLSRFADLKPEFALDALASIPKEFFKSRPGRPPASTALAQRDAGESAA